MLKRTLFRGWAAILLSRHRHSGRIGALDSLRAAVAVAPVAAVLNTRVSDVRGPGLSTSRTFMGTFGAYA